jgi:hypothetical protein
MNVLTILRSVEELLYEVMSWLLFYPRTLWMTLTRPLRTMRYSDQEQRDKPDQQYLETLSPPLFLVLSLLLAHGLELAMGLSIEAAHSPLALVIARNDQTLLAFRALMFSFHALAFAWVSLKLEKKRIDRETLRAPFFAQCYLSGATTMLVSLAAMGIRYPNDTATLVGLAVIAVTTVWYLIIQRRWLVRLEGMTGWRAGLWAIGTFAVSTSVVFAIGWWLA